MRPPSPHTIHLMRTLFVAVVSAAAGVLVNDFRSHPHLPQPTWPPQPSPPVGFVQREDQRRQQRPYPARRAIRE